MSDEQTQDSELVQKLRDTIDRISTERDELRDFKRQTVLNGTFEQYGLDPETGAGRLAMQAYDGDLAADSVASWLDEQGFSKADEQAAPEGLNQRVDQRKKLDQIAESSTPAEAQKMSREEHSKLLQENPQEALKAFREGRVEFATAAANQSSPQSPGLG